MKKLLALLIALVLCALLPTTALAISDVDVQYNNKWYGFDYDKAEFQDGSLVVWVTCPDGLPIVNGVPTVPVTAAIDVAGERLEATNTNINLLGAYAYYFFYFDTDTMPDAVWLYPDGDENQAKLLWGVPTAPTPTPEPTPDPFVGMEIMTFGSYDQDANSDNGAEPIEWIVLENDGEKATLISKFGLDAMPYNAEQEQITWETCTLRQWLNSDFLNAAFSEEELAKLMNVTVTSVPNADNSSLDPGNDTQDRVFLLSPGEASSYFDSNETRVCIPTETAIANGVQVESRGSSSWWLRTTTGPLGELDIYNRGASVGSFGMVSSSSENEVYGGYAVRPVIQLWLSDQPMPTPTPVPYPTLQKGAKGDDVARLQQALIDGGFLSGIADGDFGNMTDAAVRAAQEAFGMEPTGIADDAFLRRLYG